MDSSSPDERHSGESRKDALFVELTGSDGCQCVCFHVPQNTAGAGGALLKGLGWSLRESVQAVCSGEFEAGVVYCGFLNGVTLTIRHLKITTRRVTWMVCTDEPDKL